MVSVGSSFYTGTRLHSGRLPRGAKRTIFLKTETIEFLDGTRYPLPQDDLRLKRNPTFGQLLNAVEPRGDPVSGFKHIP